jgi:hypothetical protein
MRGIFGSVGVLLAIAVACGDDGKQPASGGAGRGNGEAGESGQAGETSGVAGGAGRGGTGATGGAGGKAGGSSSGGRAGAAGGGAGTTSAEGGAGGMLGEPGSLLPSHGKGTRLDVKELRSGDMPPVFVTFHDTELDVDCRFMRTTDGTRRCYPTSTPRLPLRAGEWFLDDECSVPVAIGDSACVAAEDSFFVEPAPASGDCEDRLERAQVIFRATLLEEGVPLFSSAGDTCAPNGVTGGTLHYFSMAEADPSDFVAGSIQIAETPTRLSVQRLVAEDGAFQTLALADPGTERECRVFTRADDSFCVSAVEFSGRGYRAADDECSVPLSLATCTEPLHIADIDANDEYVIAEAGPEHTGTVYGGVNTCDIVTGEGPFFTIGDPVPWSEFPNVTTMRQGSGRLRHLVYLDAAGTELAVGDAVGSQIMSEAGLYDMDFDDTCSLRRYTDLEHYCIPDGITTESPNNLYYADSDCTEQVAVCGESGCPTDLAILAGAGENVTCGNIADFVSVLTLGDPVELDELYIWYGGREPGMECDGPFTADAYGVIREITGDAGVDDFVQLTPAGG